MMNKETELDMNELISDFDEDSTDYTKTACTYYANYLREYQKEKLDLQQRIDKAIEFLDKVREENGNEIGQVNYETLIEILGGKE